MERVAVALDDELAGSLSRYARRRRVNRDVAAERLLAEALSEWRVDDAIERFADGEVGFTHAAAVANVDPWRFGELLQRRALAGDEPVASAADGTTAGDGGTLERRRCPTITE